MIGEDGSLRLERIEAAIKTINTHHNLGDAVYDVRERHGGDKVKGRQFKGNSWEHPTVKAYSDAVGVLQKEFPEAFK